MAEQFLSQDEVDALLDASPEPAPPAPAMQSPIDAQDDAPPVRVFDGARLERIGRRRMRTMETVHGNAALRLRASLGAYVRTEVGVAAGPIEAMRYDAFVRSLPARSSLNVVHVRPLQGQGLVTIDGPLVSLLIDRLFGGGAGRAPLANAPAPREPSPAEQRIASRVLQIAIDDYRGAWSAFYPLQLEPSRTEVDPKRAAVALAGDVVVVASFEVRIGDAGGSIRLCLPYTTLEPIRDTLFAAAPTEPAAPDRQWVGRLTQQLQHAEVQLTAELGRAQASIAELMALKAGDFIALDLAETLIAKVDDVPLYECRFGTSNGRYALRIETLLPGTRPASGAGSAASGNRP